MKFLNLSILSAFIVLSLVSSLILFYLLPDRNEALISFLMIQCPTCEAARARAEADFAQGTYRLIRTGLPDQNTRRDMITSILKADYKIETFYAGCAGSEEIDCYTNTMVNLLLDKYGTDLYDKVQSKAEQQLHNEKE